MKKYFYLLLLPLCLGLGACGSDDDDDDDDDGKTNSLVDSRVVGTWTSTIGEGWTWDHGVLNDWCRPMELFLRGHDHETCARGRIL